MATTPCVREIIQRDRPLVGAPEDTVGAAAARMAEHYCGSILVCAGEELRGIFTERDLLARVVAAGRDLLARVVAAGRDPARTCLAEVMTPDPKTIEGSAPVAEAVRRMDEGCCRHLPVLEGGRILGVISWRDVPLEIVARLRPELEQRHVLTERIW
jgi:CBS domain-containing protein